MSPQAVRGVVLLYLVPLLGCIRTARVDRPPSLPPEPAPVSSAALRRYSEHLSASRRQLEDLANRLAEDPPPTRAVLEETRQRVRAELVNQEQAEREGAGLDRATFDAVRRLVERYVRLRWTRQLQSPEPCDQQEVPECPARRKAELEQWAKTGALDVNQELLDELVTNGPAIEQDFHRSRIARDQIDEILSRAHAIRFRPDPATPAAAQRQYLERHLRASYSACRKATVETNEDAVRLTLDQCPTSFGPMSGVLEFLILDGASGETVWQVDATKYQVGDLVFDGRLLRAGFGPGGIQGKHLTLNKNCTLGGTLSVGVKRSSEGECQERENAGGRLVTCSRPMVMPISSTATPRDHVPNPIGDAVMAVPRVFEAFLALAFKTMANAPTTAMLSDPEFAAFAAICSASLPDSWGCARTALPVGPESPPRGRDRERRRG